VVEAISAFRTGKVSVIPGGGGKYGVIVLSSEGHEEVEEEEPEREQKGQLSLFDF
jgi:PHP family Zn ribbon phosphoesterase